MSKKISREVFNGFRNEVRGYLPAVRAALKKFHGEACRAELEEARRQVHIIKGASAMVGMAPLSHVAREMERILESTGNKTLVPSDGLAGLLNSALDAISTCVESAESPDTASFDGFDALLAAFTSADGLPPARLQSPADAAPQPYPADSTEPEAGQRPQSEGPPPSSGTPQLKTIPQELLEVFRLEAEDHFNTIRSLLDGLNRDSSNRSLVQDLRRTVHTLKGSAGAVRFERLAGLSHRMEDLLDALYDGALAMNDEVLHVLADAADMLEDIAAGKAGQTVLEGLYARLTAVLQSASSEKAHSEDELRSSSPGLRTEPHGPSEPAAGDDLVRVSQERIDSLIKGVGELVINRSALEQHLSSLDGRMNSLSDAVERLRLVSGRLESEYELAGMGRTEPVRSSLGAGRQEFDELELDRYTEFHHLLRQLSEAASDAKTFNHEIAAIMDECSAVSTAQGRLSGDIQTQLMDVRMVPLASITSRLRQIVRVVAQSQGKLVDLVIEGEKLEIDKKVLDEMIDPLMHVIRNDIDHGIETPDERRAQGKNERGLIRLRAYYEGSRLVIAISDDGAGLQLERIRAAAVDRGLTSPEESRSMSDEDLYQLIFHSKFSTADHISQVSGRGVGMDVVKQQVNKLQGSLTLESSPGRGTVLTIRLPMTLSIRRALLVQAWGEPYAIPLSSLKQIIRFPAGQIPADDAAQEITHENETYAYVHLGRFMATQPDGQQPKGYVPLLLVDVGTRFVALQVDAILGEREVVVKNLGSLLQRVPGVSGATVLGDGRVMLIVNPLDIGLPGKAAPFTTAAGLRPSAPREREQLTVLIVDDSISVRQVVAGLVESSGWKALVASDGFAAIEMLQTLERRPDIILLDVEMPRMDGYELLARLKSRDLWRRIPVVMLTSRAGEKHRLRALELGAAEYVVKPYQDEYMRTTIRDLVSRSRVN